MGAGGQALHQDVPSEEGMVDLRVQGNDLERPAGAATLVQQQFRPDCMAAKYREVDALGPYAGAGGESASRSNGVGRTQGDELLIRAAKGSLFQPGLGPKATETPSAGVITAFNLLITMFHRALWRP